MKKCKKVKYKTIAEAVAVIKKIAAMKNWKSPIGKKKPTRYYFCENCKHYHITSMPPELFREISKKKKKKSGCRRKMEKQIDKTPSHIKLIAEDWLRKKQIRIEE